MGLMLKIVMIILILAENLPDWYFKNLINNPSYFIICNYLTIIVTVIGTEIVFDSCEFEDYLYVLNVEFGLSRHCPSTRKIRIMMIFIDFCCFGRLFVIFLILPIFAQPCSSMFPFLICYAFTSSFSSIFIF